MGQQFPAIDDKHRAFIDAQKIFFVATAAPASKINLSPKGMGTLRVLGPNEVAYLDSTGSGNETAAHLAASLDRRMTIMFCAFDGSPVILRLYGRGEALSRGTDNYRALIHHFNEMPGARQIVRLDVDLVQTSCGMAVPLFDYKADRENLNRHWTAHGLESLVKYWQKKNMKSIDGLPTNIDPQTMGRP